MQGGLHTRFSTDDCSHTDVIEDEHEGTTVCTFCGLVLGPLMLGWKQVCMHTAKSLSEHFIYDSCDRANISNIAAVQSCERFKQLRTELDKTFKDNPIAAYAIYESLNQLHIGRSPNEILKITGVEKDDFYCVEHKINLSEKNIDPADSIERFCKHLYLNYTQIESIKLHFSNLEYLGNIQPNSTIAAVIYLYSKQHNLGKTAQKIGEICDISCANVHKTIAKIRKKSPINFDIKHPIVSPPPFGFYQ